MSTRKVLVDGDIVLHKVAIVSQFDCDWGDGVFTTHANAAEAESLLQRQLHKIGKAFGAEPFVVLSDWESDYWRRAIFPAYKSNRTTPKPLIYRHLQEYAMAHLGAIKWPRLEADDVLGILATSSHEGCVLYSIDKDLDLVPCRRSKEPGLVYRVSHAEAEANHVLLSFTGDPTDGFKGCPKVGRVEACKVLAPYLEGKEDVEWAWRAVFGRYLKAGVSYEDALIQSRLAHVLTSGEYDLETGQIVLWTPPSPVL